MEEERTENGSFGCSLKEERTERGSFGCNLEVGTGIQLPWEMEKRDWHWIGRQEFNDRDLSSH